MHPVLLHLTHPVSAVVEQEMLPMLCGNLPLKQNNVSKYVAKLQSFEGVKRPPSTFLVRPSQHNILVKNSLRSRYTSAPAVTAVSLIPRDWIDSLVGLLRGKVYG